MHKAESSLHLIAELAAAQVSLLLAVDVDSGVGIFCSHGGAVEDVENVQHTVLAPRVWDWA